MPTPTPASTPAPTLYPTPTHLNCPTYRRARRKLRCHARYLSSWAWPSVDGWGLTEYCVLEKCVCVSLSLSYISWWLGHTGLKGFSTSFFSHWWMRPHESQKPRCSFALVHLTLRTVASYAPSVCLSTVGHRSSGLPLFIALLMGSWRQASCESPLRGSLRAKCRWNSSLWMLLVVLLVRSTALRLGNPLDHMAKTTTAGRRTSNHGRQPSAE